jgi:hypothetical protein
MTENTNRQPNVTTDMIRELARFAGLPLDDDRMPAARDGLQAFLDDHVELLGIDSEANVPAFIFDPRWRETEE